MDEKIKSAIISTLKIAVAAAIIYWLVSSGKFDFRQLKALLEWQHVAIIMSLLLLNWYVASERWRMILQSQGFKTKPLLAFRLTLIGSFFNYVIPGGVGGDFVKSYYVAQENSHAKLKSVITIAIDRLLGLFSMVFMALTVMLLAYEKVFSQPDLKTVFWIIYVLFMGFMLGWSFVFSRRLYKTRIIQRLCKHIPVAGEKLASLYEAFSEYRLHKKAFFKAVILSVVSQVVAILAFVYSGWALGYNVDLQTYFFAVPVGFMITAIPIAPAGIGVGQAGYYFLFNAATGTVSQLGPLLISANQIFNFIIGLVGAGIYVTGKTPKRASKKSK